MSGRGRGMLVPAWANKIGDPTTTTTTTAPTKTPPGTVPGFTSTSQPQQPQPPTFQSHTSTPSPPPPITTQQHDNAAPQPPLPPPPSQQQQQQQQPLRVPLQFTNGWTEQIDPTNQRTYYLNTISRITTFEKPDELKTMVERQLPKSPWKEFVKDGKSYFSNRITNVSVWEEPPEFTMHKERLRALCAGEAPTRDMSSLGLYLAAQKALQELIVDTDGSLARRDQITKATVRHVDPPSRDDFVIVTSDLIGQLDATLHASSPHSMDATEEPTQEQNHTFLALLTEFHVPKFVPPPIIPPPPKYGPPPPPPPPPLPPLERVWRAALTRGIANDVRYFVLPRFEDKMKVVDMYCSSSQEEQSNDDGHKSSSLALAEFETLVQQHISRGSIHARSTFANVFTFLHLDPRSHAISQTEARTIVESHIKDLQTTHEAMRQKREAALEHVVADYLNDMWGGGGTGRSSSSSSQLITSKSSIASVMRLLPLDRLVMDGTRIPEFKVKMIVEGFLKEKWNQEMLAQKEAEKASRKAVQERITEAFRSGLVHVTTRWDDFRSGISQLKLQETASGYVNESVIERMFGDTRDEARRSVADVERELEKANVDVTELQVNQANGKISMLGGAPIPVEEHAVLLHKLVEEKGIGILQTALVNVDKRTMEKQDRFVALLNKTFPVINNNTSGDKMALAAPLSPVTTTTITHMEEGEEAPVDTALNWELADPMLKESRQYKEMSSDMLRKKTFDQWLEGRKRMNKVPMVQVRPVVGESTKNNKRARIDDVVTGTSNGNGMMDIDRIT